MCLAELHLGGEGREESVAGEGLGEEGSDEQEEGVGEEGVEERVGEEQCGGMSADTPSCFDCGRVFVSWQAVNIHSRNCY